jgi:hypothetical protein
MGWIPPGHTFPWSNQTEGGVMVPVVAKCEIRRQESVARQC